MRSPDLSTEIPARALHDELLLTGIRVLIVDDDLDIREAFQLVLEESGASVRSAESAAEALATLAVWRPDVLLSDLCMPGETGFDLMRRVAARVDAPPAAALTAHATQQGRKEALAAGFRTYVGKPIDASELIETVAALAGRRLLPTRQD